VHTGGLSGLEAISEAGEPGQEYLELSWLVDWPARRDEEDTWLSRNWYLTLIAR
jgi:hypothetical protein